MGFHINTSNMPVIKTFEQAKKEFQSRTAVRGQPHPKPSISFARLTK